MKCCGVCKHKDYDKNMKIVKRRIYPYLIAIVLIIIIIALILFH